MVPLQPFGNGIYPFGDRIDADIDLKTQHQDHGNKIKPDHQAYQRADRAIKVVVGIEYADV